MEVTNNTNTTSLTNGPAGTNPNGVLGKDDFLKLLLVQLKYQDPTEPMDSDKILSQTSQLAALEASTNTNKALEELTASLGNSLQFSTIAAIGKIADTGSNAIVVEEGTGTEFQLYFSQDVSSGTINILDSNGNTVDSIALSTTDKGVQDFTWDGKVNGEPDSPVGDRGSHTADGSSDANSGWDQRRFACPDCGTTFKGEQWLYRHRLNKPARA